MKRNSIIILFLTVLVLVSSCNSAYQASSGISGALLGGSVGETVGFLTGHGRFRGENAALGNLVGMGVGAVLGVGIASQIEKNERAADVQYTEESYDSYQTSGGAYMGAVSEASVSISDLNYMDGNGDGYLSKNETIEIEGFITNTSGNRLNNIVIYLTVDNEKNYSVSPSLTTALEKGQKIRYTGRVHCKKAHKSKVVNVQLNVAQNESKQASSRLSIGLK